MPNKNNVAIAIGAFGLGAIIVSLLYISKYKSARSVQKKKKVKPS
jgi:hypothetical protein